MARAYRAANDLFGDIVKVTPSSKVVGDMALMMVAQGIGPEAVLDPARDIAFPASVVEMLRGDLGQPPGGWPGALQDKALKGETPILVRPGSLLPGEDLEEARRQAEKKVGRHLDDRDLAASLMYPKVFADYAATQRKYGPVAVLPTPVFFYGMAPGEEMTVEIEDGKTLVIALETVGETGPDGQVKVFFELNGQPRVVTVPNRSVTPRVVARRKAADTHPGEVPAPMPGAIVSLRVVRGQAVKAGDPLLSIEAMKMETVVHAPVDGLMADLLVGAGDQVDGQDLLLVLESNAA